MSKKSLKEIEKSKYNPVGVFHCSPTNSTPFTECCSVAVIDEDKCPKCGLYVVGYESANKSGFRFSYAFRRKR